MFEKNFLFICERTHFYFWCLILLKGSTANFGLPKWQNQQCYIWWSFLETSNTQAENYVIFYILQLFCISFFFYFVWFFCFCALHPVCAKDECSCYTKHVYWLNIFSFVEKYLKQHWFYLLYQLFYTTVGNWLFSTVENQIFCILDSEQLILTKNY